MIITGTLNITSNENFAASFIMQNPRSMVCILDDTTSNLERSFPNNTISLPILLPTRSALEKEIDGDRNGFIREYSQWLDCSETVKGNISAIILALSRGIHVLFVIPYYEPDSLWINQLCQFFLIRYGIHIGSIDGNIPFNVNNSIDNQINLSNRLYIDNIIDCTTFIASLPELKITDNFVYQKLQWDISKYYPQNTPTDYAIKNMYDTTHNIGCNQSNGEFVQPLIKFE